MDGVAVAEFGAGTGALGAAGLANYHLADLSGLATNNLTPRRWPWLSRILLVPPALTCDMGLLPLGTNNLTGDSGRRGSRVNLLPPRALIPYYYSLRTAYPVNKAGA